MKPDFWKGKVAGLPRWAWAALLVGGVGVGLYLRKHTSESEPVEEEEESEGYLNSGNLMPPAAPIPMESSGSSGGASYVPLPYKPTAPIEQIPTTTEPSESPEVPEQQAPPEQVIGEPHKPVKPRPPIPVVENTPIGGKGGKHPVTVGERKPVPISTSEHERAHREMERLNNEINGLQADINRLVNEINGLQNHIAQLTSVLQAHPHAAQRPQWEAERNQDRANIENKRNRINQDQANISNKRAELQYWGARL